MIKATLTKGIYWGLAYRFRGLVHYHHGGKHGSMQADVVLEMVLELRVASPLDTLENICILKCREEA